MKTIACLAGDGVGPELMAAATRALDRVAELHSLQLDDEHLPFGGEAVTRTGHPLPPETRAGYRDVDAILVAVTRQSGARRRQGRSRARVARCPRPAGRRRRSRDHGAGWGLGKQDCARARVLEHRCAARPGALRRRVRRLAGGGRGGARALEWARGRGGIARAGARPSPRAARVARCGRDRVAVRRRDGRHGRAFRRLTRVGGPGVAARTKGRACSSPARASRTTSPASGSSTPVACCSTASLMLAEGLKRRSASRTLERAVERPPSARAAGGRDTRSFTDAVIELLPQSRVDLEHFDEVWA